RTWLLHVRLLHRRLIALEQRRSADLHPPRDVLKDLPKPWCAIAVVRAFPMAGSMEPDAVLVHCLCEHCHLQFLFALSTDRVRDSVAILHEPPLLLLHSREHAMRLTQREQTSPLFLGKVKHTSLLCSRACPASSHPLKQWSRC